MLKNRIFALALLSACAHGLKSESDIRVAPEDFIQKIENIDGSKSTERGVNEPVSTKAQQLEGLKKLLGQVKTPTLITPVSKPEKNKVSKKAIGAALTQSQAIKTALPAKTWTPTQWPYGIGEKITMVLRYGMLEGGIASLEVMDFQKINNEPVIHYQGRVKSSRVLELFYHVDDVMDSWVGLGDHLPRRQEIKQLESNRWGRRVVVFDSQKQRAKFYAHADFQDGHSEELKREDAIAPFAQDVFAALYFYRFINMGESRVNFPIHDRFKNWSNEFTFVGREKIKVPLGEFDTIHYKMFPRVSGDLAPKGDVEIWVSDDPRHIMLQFKAKIKVGSITGEVKEYQPGQSISISPPVMKTVTDLPAETSK